MSYLTLDNITFQYPNGFTAIENVNLSIDEGESIAIIGQNGAGKTTTVKLMNGLIKPTSGDVIIDGWNTKEYTTAQMSKKVGYVFQNPDEQIFHNNIYSEIEFGPKNLGFSAEEVKANVLRAAKLVGVEDLLEEHPYNLPYSMRKFVTIASVIAMDSSVIILDEPTAGQDVTALKRLTTVIDTLIAEGKTIITITHDMEFVVKNFNRVVVMANKQKIADDNKYNIFWDFDVLEKWMLKQPHISRLSHRLDLDENILSIDEMVNCLKQHNASKV